jgi:hypothetical protein
MTRDTIKELDLLPIDPTRLNTAGSEIAVYARTVLRKPAR